MKRCPFCKTATEEEATTCQSCGKNLTGLQTGERSIFYCPRCNTEKTYTDSTNRIFCPYCRNYVKDQELK